MTFRNRSKAEMKAWLRDNVRLDDECRIWAGTIGNGMPLVCWMPYGKRLKARHLLLQLMGRETGPVVWSTCGRPDCMNPAHLLTGQRREMIAWMAGKGRFCRGIPRVIASAAGRNARLGLRHAREVAAALAAGQTQIAIAAQYGVHPTAVGHALRRWRNAGVI